MKYSISNILFSIMIGIVGIFVSICFFIMYLIEVTIDLLQEGTQRLKKTRR